MSFKEVVAVALGGACGSLLRFGLATWVQRFMPSSNNFPLGILFVNVTGCLLIGFFSGFLFDRLGLGVLWWRAAIFIGFLGGFTTFSTFSLDTLYLIQTQAYVSAAMNVIVSLLACLLATPLGLLLAKGFSA